MSAVKVVGKQRKLGPRDLLLEAGRLCDSVDRWNPYLRPRGQVFKFRTWEARERWRCSQTNPRLH
jgi:hypothetical protein